mgnify:CR=1 FL=1
MRQLYAEVHPDDFIKLGGDKPPHLLIEQKLIFLGHQFGNSSEFKKEVLKIAGWTGGALTTYASRAEKAAEVFNRIRDALEGVESPDDLIKNLQTLH